MIMDEPTNHLDIDTVEALAQALRLIFDDYIFHIDVEGIALTPSFVVITIDVNKNAAIGRLPGSSKEGWSWSLMIRICFRVFATRSLFSSLFNKNSLRWTFSYFSSCITRYNCICTGLGLPRWDS